MPPQDKPVWLKAITEPVRTAYYARFYLHAYRTPARGELYAFPEVPTRPQLMWKVARLTGLRLAGRPSPATRLAMVFQGTTVVDTTGCAPPPEGVRVLNRGCLDISKSRVERAHREVFGYGMGVDPTTHAGPMVAKSDENAAHDGRVIEGPIDDPEPGVVYQVAIDNTAQPPPGAPANGPLVADLRVTVVGDELPLAFTKYRPKAIRFENRNTHVTRHESADLFDSGERANILAFARVMGLDVGEIDLLRDRGTGRLYAIDVNSTPHSPPSLLERPGVGYEVMRKAARAFEGQWLA